MRQPSFSVWSTWSFDSGKYRPAYQASASHEPNYFVLHRLCLQVHSLLNVVRPDRQTLLFSATLPRKIEALVAEALSNPVRISVGLLGAANADVTQKVEILKGELERAGHPSPLLVAHLVHLTVVPSGVSHNNIIDCMILRLASSGCTL
jgi:hypothetical protein